MVVRAFLGWFAVSLALWMVMAGSLALPELVAGTAVAAVAAATGAAIRPRRPAARPGAAEVRRLAAATGRIPQDLVLLMRVLGRELLGRPSLGGFDVVTVAGAASPEDPRAAARRVLVPIAESLSPGTYAVSTDPEGTRVLIHRLVAGGAPPAEEPR